MYLSRLYIKNYRSISEIDLSFSRWKNIIVGRNNSGKSNIIKALDVVLWENSPTYNKSENITESDFFHGKITEPIYIFCELQSDEEFKAEDYKSMYQNCFGFKIYSEVDEWGEDRKPKTRKLKEMYLEDDLSNLEDFFEKTEDNVWFDTDWIDLKKPEKQQLEKILKWKRRFAFVFKAYFEKWLIQKESRFLIKSSHSGEWWMSFKDNLRNIFLQSAIIPAFRDTKDQLRISNYSWYGKLLKSYIDSDDKNLKIAFDWVKTAGQSVFNKLQTEVWDGKINIAFPNTEISFQFNPEKQEVYKNTQIYINDGFNSPLQNKWSGIQSAVIIGLFDFYIRNIAHSGGSLLAIEEPELYLHPHGRRVISDRLNNFLDGWKNQVIITTHSPEFIVPLADDLNIIILRKDEASWTKWENINFSDPDKRQILIKKESAEMFFADIVILTEDCKHFVEEVAKIFWKKHEKLWENWINNNNVSILNCGWKTWFHRYKNLLDLAKIPNYILADFDYLRDGWIENNLSDLWKLNEIKSKITTIHPSIDIHDIKEIAIHIQSEDFWKANRAIDLLSREVKKRMKHGNYKKLSEIEEKHHEDIKLLMENLKQDGIYLLEWELEDIYHSWKESSFGKEKGVIETIGKIIKNWESIADYINTAQIEIFLEHIARDLDAMKNKKREKDDEQESIIVPKKVNYTTTEIHIEDIPF